MKSLQRIKKTRNNFLRLSTKIEKSAEDQKNQKNQFSETPREIKKSAEDQKNQKKTKKNNFLRLLGK